MDLALYRTIIFKLYFILLCDKMLNTPVNKHEFHRPTIYATSDGSSTLVHPLLEELYHSRHGAWTESQHIFIKDGLMPVVAKGQKQISIFEMGFGSGLNAALAREMAIAFNLSVLYTTVELYPVDLEVISKMEMPEQLVEERERWMELHRSDWDQEVLIDSFFTLNKTKASFPDDPVPGSGCYDLVFYDAFAPAVQPELWGEEALGQCYNLLGSGGMWLSYCAKGQVRRNLKAVGFEIEGLPGPPGKREITRAVKR